MLPASKKKTLSAIKRLKGLTTKLETMVEQDDYCPELLSMLLSMKGHIKQMQGVVLESHLQTCAPKKLKPNGTAQKKFVDELLNVIGLSTR